MIASQDEIARLQGAFEDLQSQLGALLTSSRTKLDDAANTVSEMTGWELKTMKALIDKEISWRAE